MTSTRLAAAAALATALLAAAGSAHAQSANRAWVSGKGTDAAGCGAPTSACRSFQYVHDHIVAAGGEIDALDGAGYGAVTITKALSIVGVGAVVAVQQPNAGQNAITINAGPADHVQLRGLTIDGLGQGQEGIQFNTGAALDVVNCVVRHFADNGVNVQSSTAGAKVSITDTLISDVATDGIYLVPSVSISAALRGVTLDDSQIGLMVRAIFAGIVVQASAVDTTASGNWSRGFEALGQAPGASAVLSLRNVTATNNGTGVAAALFNGGVGQVTLGRSLIAGNGDGAYDGAGFDGTIFSFGDNRFNGNGTDVDGSLTAITAK